MAHFSRPLCLLVAHFATEREPKIDPGSVQRSDSFDRGAATAAPLAVPPLRSLPRTSPSFPSETWPPAAVPKPSTAPHLIAPLRLHDVRCSWVLRRVLPLPTSPRRPLHLRGPPRSPPPPSRPPDLAAAAKSSTHLEAAAFLCFHKVGHLASNSWICHCLRLLR